jgi:DNA polymerase-3 subunit delta'
MLTFDAILGQSAAIDLLRRALAAGRLPHGLIFSGKTGVGKATTAAALGAAFLCHHPAEARPCGRCESCRGMLHGNHPDYHVITKELIRNYDKQGKSKAIDLSVKVIRPELIEPANRKPMLNHGKVFVVEQAELMNPAAQNALLKTLEEPLGPTLITLLSDQPESLLPTIRSRAQVVRFANLDRKLIEEQLAQRGVEPARAALAAGLADGSLGLAIQWLADGVADGAVDLVRRLDRVLSGGPQAAEAADDLPDWFKSAAEAFAKRQLDRDPLASKDQATRAGLALYLQIAARRFAQLLPQQGDPARQSALCDAIDALARAEH